MAQIITPDDVASHTSGLSESDVATLVDGINAKASRVAPCLAGNPSSDLLAEARLVLIGAVKRWAESGSGAFSQQTAGPWSVSTDTRQKVSGYNLWPSEIDALRELCAGESEPTRAFSIRPQGATWMGRHVDWCNLFMGGTSCSCGVNLTHSEPLYELP